MTAKCGLSGEQKFNKYEKYIRIMFGCKGFKFTEICDYKLMRNLTYCSSKYWVN